MKMKIFYKNKNCCKLLVVISFKQQWQQQELIKETPKVFNKNKTTFFYRAKQKNNILNTKVNQNISTNAFAFLKGQKI